MHSEEEDAARYLGETIGYGRVMQLAEQVWERKTPGAAHSVGCCTAFLVPCEHVGFANAVACDWCCGAGRVTKRVLAAQRGS